MSLHIEPTDDEPAFEQVRRQIAEGAASGAFPAGHRLPTVRALAATLGLAANTVAKAYRALETDGVIETHGRNGTLVANRRSPDDASVEAARALVQQARRQGLSRDETVRLVDDVWA